MYNHLSIATSTILAKTRHYPSTLREPFPFSHDSTIDGVVLEIGLAGLAKGLSTLETDRPSSPHWKL